MHDHHDATEVPTRAGGHPWWMWALCLLPIAAIVAMTVFSVPFSSVLWVGVLLLCPLMHVFMMGGHGHGSAQPTERDVQVKKKV